MAETQINVDHGDLPEVPDQSFREWWRERRAD